MNATGTITVTAANTAGAASSTPTLCINTTLTNITHTTTGATGIGTATGLPTGVTAAWASNRITISGTPTQSGTFNYSIPLTGGCGSVNATGTITVTARPVAGTLDGTQEICVLGSTTFSSTVSGGAWSSSANTIATVDAASGLVTGIAAGTATMTYTVTGTGGCADVSATRIVTVTNPPSAGLLSGPQDICVAGTTPLTSTVSGGTWSSSAVSVATINATSGVATGVAAGIATMTYTVAGTGGCANASATRIVTVTAAPSAGTLSGTQSICVSSAVLFNSTSPGGSWSSSNSLIATINATTGSVSGIAPGTATMTYVVPGTGGCANASATR
ncbi:MAG TPA: hypothetical protein DCP55_07760, partial [Chitinophagaceae bacterium]|nr:hypothetical protein [Chitinophagaceae bacterium]